MFDEVTQCVEHARLERHAFALASQLACCDIQLERTKGQHHCLRPTLTCVGGVEWSRKVAIQQRKDKGTTSPLQKETRYMTSGQIRILGGHRFSTEQATL